MNKRGTTQIGSITPHVVRCFANSYGDRAEFVWRSGSLLCFCILSGVTCCPKLYIYVKKKDEY